MRLHLDMEGIFFDFEIRDYSRENRDEYGYTWCRADFSFTSEQWLNYGKQNDEVLTAEEIDDLAEILDKLLTGELQQPEKIQFIEPDFILNLVPGQKNRSEPGMEWQVYFWERGNGLTENYLSLYFGREDLEALQIYLKFVQGKLSEKDAVVRNLVQHGILQ